MSYAPVIPDGEQTHLHIVNLAQKKEQELITSRKINRMM
jgi:hypothetical protein